MTPEEIDALKALEQRDRMNEALGDLREAQLGHLENIAELRRLLFEDDED